MSKFDEFKENFGENVEFLAGRAVGLAKVAAEKTKVMAKIGKLNAEILGQKDNIRKAYQEIGKIYYDYFQLDPHEPMKETCAKIDAAMAVIADRQAEIEVLKSENPSQEYAEYTSAEYTAASEKTEEEKKTAKNEICTQDDEPEIKEEKTEE